MSAEEQDRGRSCCAMAPEVVVTRYERQRDDERNSDEG